MEDSDLGGKYDRRGHGIAVERVLYDELLGSTYFKDCSLSEVQLILPFYPQVPHSRNHPN